MIAAFHPLAALLLLLLCPAISAAQQAAKVGFIYNESIGDVGWTHQHDLGRQEMEKALASRVAVKTVPNTAEGTDGARAARELTVDGSKMIFAAGFGYMRSILRIAADNPGTCYAVATGFVTSPNVSGYTARWYEGGYLAGIVAGKSTRLNSIGFVGAHAVPDVMWYLNAFVLGVRSVNPNAIVRAVFVGSWSAPQKETETAISLINQGVDVIAHYTNSPAVVVASDARDVASISFHSDMRKHAPKHYLTGVTHHWGNYYTKMASEVIAGRCQGSLYVGGIKEGNIKLAPFSSRVTKDVVDLVDSKSREIVEGRLKIFSGPIKDTQGIVRVQPGAVLSHMDLQKAFWFVQGVSVAYSL